MPELEGQDKGGPIKSPFRSAKSTHRAGWGSDMTGQAVVVDVHPRTWRVDVVTKFDRRTYKGVQVGSPYLHYAGGEGISVMPEIGAKCHVTIPADGSEPFLSSFIAPLETQGAEKVVTGDGTTVLVSPDGKTKANPGDASFAAGRARRTRETSSCRPGTGIGSRSVAVGSSRSARAPSPSASTSRSPTS